METCVGCGSPLAPAWKFCVYCGIAVEPREEIEIPAAFRPAPAAVAVIAQDHRTRNRMLLFGGIGIFLVGIALLVIAVALFSGTLR